MIDLFKKILLGFGVSLVFFVLIELILFALGVVPLYERTDPYVGFSGYSPLFVKNSSPSEEAFYETAPNKIRWFNHQRFPYTKSEGVTRIFCVGGSTTYGRPYNDLTSFCGWLRVFLPNVDPTRQWEVINAGGISYASYRVANLMEELAEYEPDVFIVYSGHNEFLEKRTYEKLLKTPVFIRNLASLASRMRLYSVMHDITYSEGDILSTEVKTLLDRTIGPENYHRDDEMQKAVLEHYHNSLNRMTEISERAGSKIIFVSPASNIGGFSPFKSQPDSSLGDQEIQQINKLKQSISDALVNGDSIRASKISKKAVAYDNRDADLLFLRAQSLLALGKINEAKKTFRAARDEDVCPLRALTEIDEIVENVAKTSNTGFVDFVETVTEYSPNGIPGDNLFLDHVHPTIEGNRLLAQTIVQELENEEILNIADTWNESLISKISEKIENSLDDRAHAVALKNLSKVLSWAGKFEEAERLANLAMDAIPQDAENHFQKGILAKKSGNIKGALVYYMEAARLAPWNPQIRRELGVILSELGRASEAQFELEAAIELDPKMVDAYYDLGIVMQSIGNRKKAENLYRKALELDPLHIEARNNLGVVFAQSGNLPAAYDQFAQALRLNPDHKGAAANLERARIALGR